jgi:hypothetical protein
LEKEETYPKEIGGVCRLIAVDISGRHEADGRYLMVCSAVSVKLKADAVDGVNSMEFDVLDTEREPRFEVVVDTVSRAVSRLGIDAPVVAEEGEFYNKPDWIVEGALGTDFKYVETIGERKAVDVAHHSAYAVRSLLLRHEGQSGTR